MQKWPLSIKKGSFWLAKWSLAEEKLRLRVNMASQREKLNSRRGKMIPPSSETVSLVENIVPFNGKWSLSVANNLLYWRNDLSVRSGPSLSRKKAPLSVVTWSSYDGKWFPSGRMISFSRRRISHSGSALSKRKKVPPK